ncbi:hypothetical protein DPMN_109651 [Dreissena polymorpha]|uniref:Methyltransferase FkbM domain-containing protein n=2 Tax=Dreissena polymorpha TaxID=45954 RepID=A0A9D4QM66_DREPO|nr:hypothetical protein DPMN_109651 [Dreissena polymorpha]
MQRINVKKAILLGVIFLGIGYIGFHALDKGNALSDDQNVDVHDLNKFVRRANDASVKDINMNINKVLANQSEGFEKALLQKYGPIQFSSVHQVSTLLTSQEEARQRECIKNGPRDRGQNGSKFWGAAEHIRRTHHGYLAREDAVLIEVGGNQGNDASEFVRLYNPRYIVLEPLEQYAEILRNKFQNNSRVTVINLGLGAKNEVLFVKIEGNNACATSKFSGMGGETPLYISNATEFMMKLGVGVFEVDLLTLNCEGCEYEALETLLSTSLVRHFRNIQWATHSEIPGIPDPVGRYCRIQELLSRTHRPTYQYRLIWESWRRRNLA